MFKKNNKMLVIAMAGLINISYSNAETTVIRGADTFGGPVQPAVVNIDMKSIQDTTKWKVGDPILEKPLINRRAKDNPFQDSAERGFGEDSLAKRQESINNFGTVGSDVGFSQAIVNREGEGFTGVSPPDTNGDVGLDYYIQSINNNNSSRILILNKSDGSTASQFVLDSLAAGSGTGCGAGDGDPIIFFDQFAENNQGEPNGRWVLTEFTSSSMCLYVSQTSDPTAGTWFVYEFQSTTGTRPDYPKFGNWSNAYFVGANEGPFQYAFDKENILNGATARPPQVFGGQGLGLPGFGFQHLMPADADGDTLPPDGAPGIFMRHRDGDYHDNGNLPDVLEIFEFSVDWDDSNNSTFTGPINIEVSEFDTNLGGTNFDDLSVPQPSGTNLFPLKQPLMWRLQHRTIDDRQLIVGNMVTDVDGNDLHGVRWFQLERPAATVSEGWSLADEGTYALGDTVNRWMASTAMDGDGNIAIGYNVSDNNTFPGMRYAGRLVSDPPGTMPQGEYSIIEGSASSGSFRYGDYTSLNVDPVDECTFWYTAQYNSAANWSTRIASFKFDQCGCQLKLDTVTVTGTSVIGDNAIQVEWNDSAVNEITEYRIFRSTTQGSGYVQIATVNDTIGLGPAGDYTYDDTTVSGGTEYFYIVRASDGGSCLTQSSNESSTIATGVCTLAPNFSGIASVENNGELACSLSVGWSSAATNCPNGAASMDYSVYRSEMPGFEPDPSNLLTTLTDELEYEDTDENLVSGTKYYYKVRATDLDNDIQESNTQEANNAPTGPITPQVFNETLENYQDIDDAI
ncbi:MAG: fibronectin type III domain-containing protein, partial [Marinicellaceae bacterium]